MPFVGSLISLRLIATLSSQQHLEFPSDCFPRSSVCISCVRCLYYIVTFMVFYHCNDRSVQTRSPLRKFSQFPSLLICFKYKYFPQQFVSTFLKFTFFPLGKRLCFIIDKGGKEMVALFLFFRRRKDRRQHIHNFYQSRPSPRNIHATLEPIIVFTTIRTALNTANITPTRLASRTP